MTINFIIIWAGLRGFFGTCHHRSHVGLLYLFPTPQKGRVPVAKGFHFIPFIPLSLKYSVWVSFPPLDNISGRHCRFLDGDRIHRVCRLNGMNHIFIFTDLQLQFTITYTRRCWNGVPLGWGLQQTTSLLIKDLAGDAHCRGRCDSQPMSVEWELVTQIIPARWKLFTFFLIFFSSPILSMEEPEDGLGRTDDHAHGIPTAGTGSDFLGWIPAINTCTALMEKNWPDLWPHSMGIALGFFFLLSQMLTNTSSL